MATLIPNNFEYRILEYDGKFKIQVKTKYVKHIFLKKKLITEWVPVNKDGKPICFLDGEKPIFNTYEDALNKIYTWKKGTIIRYPPELPANETIKNYNQVKKDT